MGKKINIWRQAYRNTEGTVRSAAIIHSSNTDSKEEAFTDFAWSQGKIWHKNPFDNKGRWNNLKVFINEDDANKEIFNINRYGR